MAGRADHGRGDDPYRHRQPRRSGLLPVPRHPQQWIGPSTEDEIERAAHDKVAVLVVPIAFVSEHSETLVELDIEYRHLAEGNGVPVYLRAPTVGVAPEFIAGLARLVREGGGDRCCPGGFSGCGGEGGGAP